MPLDKADHLEQLQETMLLGIYNELLMREKSVIFRGKVTQYVRNDCVLVAMPMSIPKTYF